MVSFIEYHLAHAAIYFQTQVGAILLKFYPLMFKVTLRLPFYTVETTF